MTWVRGPRSTFGLPTFEKRDPPPCAVPHGKIGPPLSLIRELPKSTEQQKISALVMTYDTCQPQALTHRETATHG
jgi:hypothetical protein